MIFARFLFIINLLFVLNSCTKDDEISVVGCDLTTTISGFENLYEDCSDALQGEGKVSFVRPNYWLSN